MPRTDTTPKLIECTAGLRNEGGFFVVSPRTGARVEVPATFRSLLSHRVAGRIAQAAARGQRTVCFTVDELKRIKDIADVASLVEVTKPAAPFVRTTLRYWGKPGRSWSRR